MLTVRYLVIEIIGYVHAIYHNYKICMHDFGSSKMNWQNGMLSFHVMAFAACDLLIYKTVVVGN